MVTGFLAAFAIAIFWDVNFIIASMDVSAPLLVLFFIVGACSSSTSVINFAFVAVHPQSCTTYMATGMGFGSMVGGLTSLIIGSLTTSKNSVSVIVAFIAFLYIPAIISLTYIEPPGLEQAEHETSPDQLDNKFENEKPSDHLESEKKALLPKIGEGDNRENGDKDTMTEFNFLSKYFPILCLQAFTSGLGHGLVPSLISSVCGRFEYPHTTLSLATGIAAVLDPACRFLSGYYRFKTLNEVMMSSAVLSGLSAVLVVCAVLPSDAGIFSDPWGGILPAMIHISFISLFVFTNTCIFLVLKDTIPDDCIGHAYKWSGLSVQIGAVVGTVVSFTLIMLGVM